MKKYLIILICALLAFSLISCEKEQTDDVVSSFDSFMNASMTEYPLSSTFGNYIPSGTTSGEEETFNYNLTKENRVVTGPLASLIMGEIGTEKNIDIKSWEVTSGDLKVKISGKEIKENGVFEVTVTDAKLICTYDIVDDETGTIKESNLKYELTINMKYRVTVEDSKLKSVSMVSSMNSKKYDFSYTQDIPTMKYISATVNGKKVDVRLINLFIQFSH